MKVGDLNKRITVQTATRTADGLGGFTEVWANTFKAWAAIWPVSAVEQVRNQSISTEISHRIRMRYRSGVTTAQRIKFGSRYFNIAAVINPNEKDEMLDIIAKELV